MRRPFFRLLLPLCAVTACAFATPAFASEALSDPNAKLQSLEVNSKGEALVTYRRTDGKLRRVLVWDAVNSAISGDPAARQVRFKYDYAGGWGKYHKASYWSTFKNRCTPYDGPALVYFVAGCKAPDGTYWAIQSWQRLQPLLGFDPWLPEHTAYELHLSHWNSELAKIASLADELDLPDGRELTHEGATGKEFLILVEGEGEIMRDGNLIAGLAPGDFVGEIALVTGIPRTATVRTRGPSRVLVIGAQAFKTLMRDVPAIQTHVLMAVAARLPRD